MWPWIIAGIAALGSAYFKGKSTAYGDVALNPDREDSDENYIPIVSELSGVTKPSVSMATLAIAGVAVYMLLKKR